jgi:hypothetical protein
LLIWAMPFLQAFLGLLCLIPWVHIRDVIVLGSDWQRGHEHRTQLCSLMPHLAVCTQTTSTPRALVSAFPWGCLLKQTNHIRLCTVMKV